MRVEASVSACHPIFSGILKQTIHLTLSFFMPVTVKMIDNDHLVFSVSSRHTS